MYGHIFDSYSYFAYHSTEKMTDQHKKIAELCLYTMSSTAREPYANIEPNKNLTLTVIATVSTNTEKRLGRSLVSDSSHVVPLFFARYRVLTSLWARIRKVIEREISNSALFTFRATIIGEEAKHWYKDDGGLTLKLCQDSKYWTLDWALK